MVIKSQKYIKNWWSGDLQPSAMDSTLGRDDFNLTFMIFFGELPYDIGYQKKHIRLHEGG